MSDSLNDRFGREMFSIDYEIELICQSKSHF